MNIKNMKRLIAHLEDPKNPIGFYMGQWFTHNGRDQETRGDVLYTVENHACGTDACIAGHAAYLAWALDYDKGEVIANVAQGSLELTDVERYNLFHGHWSNKELSQVTRAETIAHLKMLGASRAGTQWEWG